MKPALGALAFASLASLAHADDKVTFLTSWYAQAEHGGYYQAVATGIYRKYGLDVAIKMGGPQNVRHRSPHFVSSLPPEGAQASLGAARREA